MNNMKLKEKILSLSGLLFEDEEQPIKPNWKIHNREPINIDKKFYKTVEILFDNGYLIYIEPMASLFSMSFYFKNQFIAIGKKSSNYISDFDHIIARIRSLNTEYEFINGDLINQLQNDIYRYLNNIKE
jgi:hypothetical protein